jgi:hypothetical protein
VNPQEVFRSHLPVGTSLLVIFVSSRDRNGQAIDQEHWVDEVLTTLGRLFCGATTYACVGESGLMMNIAEGSFRGSLSSFFVCIRGRPNHQRLPELHCTLSRMGRQANQGEIGVVTTANTIESPNMSRSN